MPQRVVAGAGTDALPQAKGFTAFEPPAQVKKVGRAHDGAVFVALNRFGSSVFVKAVKPVVLQVRMKKNDFLNRQRLGEQDGGVEKHRPDFL